MDVNRFINEILHELSNCDFVEKVDIHLEIITVKGRIFLKNPTSYLDIYYNEQTGTTAFALIESNKRIWGIDYDNVRTWHEHPLENPENHNLIKAMNISEIINKLQKIYECLQAGKK